MSQHKCELCGTPVKVVGRTTLHYEPIDPVASVKVKEPIWPENWKCSKHGEAWLSSDKYPKGCCECHEAFCANKMKIEIIQAWKDAQKGLV